MNSATKNTIKTIMSRVLVVLLSYAMVSSTSPVGYVAAYGLDEATDQAAQTEQTTTDQSAEAAPAESTQAAPAESTQSTTTQQSTQQSTQQAATEQTIALNLGNGYITYYGQTIAAPTSSLTVPTDRDFTFAAAANGGYTLKAVYRTMGESETPIAANSDGTYTLHASDFAAGVGIRIDAEAASTESASTTSLTSAADALNQVLADSTETVYTYEDEHVSVKATLSDPHAVPDDAQFVVTQVTPDTKDADGNPAYNYDAYMDALNGGKTTDDSTYTSDNTLLYDVAFMYPELGDDGQPTGKTVEFEPAAGTVKIEITYKQNQLTDAIDAQDSSDVDVIHLPLKTSTRDSVDTTADATNITKDDIKVEAVNSNVNVDVQQVELTTSDLSVFAYTTAGSFDQVASVADFDLDTYLGQAAGYGIIANTYKHYGDTETNMMVGTYDCTTKDLGSSSNYSNAGGSNYFGKFINVANEGLCFYHTPAHIYLGPDATKQYEAGQVKFSNVDGTDIVENSDINVSTVLSNIDTNFGKLDNYGAQLSNNGKLDLTNLPAGTYIVTYTGSDVTEQTLDVKMNANQRLIVNCTSTTLNMMRYHLNGKQPSEYIGNKNEDADWATTAVIFNMVNGGTVNMTESMGVIINPTGSVYTNGGACGGIMVANNTEGGNEWHYHNHHLEKPGSTGFTFAKTVDGAAATVNGFSFSLYQKDGSSWKPLQTVSNEGGAIAFDKITYDKSNCSGDKTTFIYKVVENGNGKVTLNGTDYTTDTTVYYVKVVVTKKTSGDTTTYVASSPKYFTDEDCKTAVDGVPTFSNATLQNGSLTINKKSVGKTTPADATFTVTGPDGYSKTVKYSEFKNGSYTLSGLVAGDYTVTEDTTGAKIAGYNLTVSDGGAVTTQVTAGNESTVTLTNTYTKKTGMVTFSGTKSYDGQLSAGLFHFTATLMSVHGKTDAAGVGTQYHASNAADGTFSFGPIEVKKAGTYVYQVTEDNGGKTVGGVVYDNATYTVTVKVSEGDTSLTSQVVSIKDADGNDVKAVTFTNRDYTATGEVTFAGKKIVSGRDMTADDVYTFVVSENGTNKSWTVHNNTTDGKIAYPTIQYTLADVGTHTYTVTETAGTDSSIKYDSTSYTVTVNVSDNGDGTLKVEKSSNATELNFTNTYTATGELQLSGIKTLENQGLNGTTAQLFTYEVLEQKADGTLTTIASPVATNADGSIDFPKISYQLKDKGLHTYIVREIIPEGSEKVGDTNFWKSGSYIYDGHNYTFTVDVEDAGNGTLSVTKTSGSVNFSTQDGAKVTGLDFTNTYEASGDVTLTVNKALTGRAPNANEFEFVLKDAKGNQIGNTVKNDEHGLATFPTIAYTKKSLKQAVADGTATLNADGTYTIIYTISEKAGSDSHITYSKDVVTATVTVVDDGHGRLTATVSYTGNDTITNTYDASGSITLTGTKTYEGQTAGQFTFTAVEQLDGVATGRVFHGRNDANGNITFDEIPYTLAQLRNADGTYSSKTFTYTVSEDKGGTTAGGITYDGAKKTVKVTVSDNGDGTLSAVTTEDSQAIAFTNTYKAKGSVTFEGMKTMEGRVLGAGDTYTYTVKEGDKTVATGRSDSTGTITFTSISYELGRGESQTHTYTITEDTPTQAGVSKASDPVTVKVTVADDGHGGVTVTKTEGDYQAVNFTNKYESSGKLELAGTKSMTGRELKQGDNFTYTVKDKATGKIVSTGTSDESGTIKYQDITYSRDDLMNADGTYAESKTYTYVVSEDPVDTTKVPGVTASTTTYEFTVTITDDGQGHINVTHTGDDPEKLDFTNTYTAEGSVQFHGTKSMEGRDLTGADVYSFTISENNQVLYTFSNTGATINYPEIDYKLADVGEHTYTIAEVAHDAAGVTTDTKTYTVKVNVSDKGNGTLEVKTSGDNPQQLNFTNTYETSASVELGGTKKITGREFVEGDSYTFTLTGKDGAPMPTGADKANNTATVTVNPTSGSEVGFNFGTIAYTQADAGKTYTYEVREQAGNAGGLTYDDTVKTVKVKVTDDGKGNLSAQVVSDKSDAVVFTNTYEHDSTSISFNGAKSLTGRSQKAGEFHFQITEGDRVVSTGTNASDGTIAFTNIKYDEAGEHDYTVSEVIPADAENADGVKYSDATAEQKTAGGFTYKGVTYSNASYSIHVSVTDDNQGHLHATRTDTVGTFAFSNAYDASGSIKLKGHKAYDGPTDAQFTFTVKDEAGNVVKSVTRNGAGDFEFPAIEYTLSQLRNEDGTYSAKTFKYTVSETAGDSEATGITYDSMEYPIEVTVSDNGDGTLKAEVTKGKETYSFKNTYSAQGELVLTGHKALKNEKLDAETAKLFTYSVTDEAGKTVSTGTTDAKGNITFKPIEYTLADAGKTFTYTVSEDHGGKTIDGVKYDNTTYTVQVEVSDANHNGVLTVTPTSDSAATNGMNFTNTYSAKGSVTLEGTKTYEGDKTGFTFTAVEQENGKNTGRTFSGTTDKDGHITFDEIGYTLANVGHTYTYAVTEDVPGQAKNADGIAYADATAEQRAAGGFVYNGITYSNAAQTVTVEVKDDVKDGELEITKSDNFQSLDFTNTYGAKGSITLEGTKTLTGRALQKGEFTFQVKEGNSVVVTGTNDANGNITFGTINYTEVGEHDYTVTEVTPTQGGVTAETEPYKIHVSVTDPNHNGELVASRTDNAGPLNFTNTYEAAGDVTFHGTKSFDTRTVRSSDTFMFNIDETTATVAEDARYHGTATSKGGAIAYPSISYTLADVGTHTYHVTEAATDAGGVTASTQSYDVTVTVADHGNGTLDITTSDNADALNFTNAYSANGQATLTGTKTLTGRDMGEGEFGFTVTDASGNTVSTGSNAAATNGQAGAITFTPITYTQADMLDADGKYVSAKDFTYTIQENAGTKGGVAYSGQSFQVKVHVVDNGDGTLTATPSYPDGDIAFTNTYTHERTQVTFGGHKYVENKNEANADKTFTFQLTETTEDVAAADRVSQTVTRTGAGEYSFAPISYTEPGVHTYEIKETAGSDHGYTYDTKVYHVTVTVKDNGQGELVAAATDTDTGAAFVTDSADFTNTYQAEATDLTLSAVKNLTGREWKDTDNFTFQLTAVDNAPMPAEGGDTATAATTGKHEATFGSIHYTQAGTYEYNISELAPTGDGVVDNHDNTYTLNGVTYDISAYSDVIVTVEDVDGRLVATAKYDNKADLPVFTNKYQASETTATLEATKQLNGGEIADFDGKFSFTLKGEDGAPMPTAAADSDTLTVANNGTAVSFGEIAYDTAGTYNYTITEVQGDQGGVTYDKTEHKAQVVVADDGNGALHATVTYDDVAATDDTSSPAPAFTNTYFAAKASIAADKHFFGAGNGTFEFTLTKTDASWNALNGDTGASVTYGAGDTIADEGQPFQVVVNNGAYENGVAKVEFPDITYYKAGTYYYKLAETSEDATDASVYLVTVTVDENQQATVSYQAVRDGQEIADATSTDAAVFYNNGYVAVKGAARRARAARDAEHSVSVMPVVQKELDGATLEAGEFTFQLVGEDGTNVTAANDADGTVAFARKTADGVDVKSDDNGVLTFTKPGTYTYTITEVKGEDQLIKYDDSEVTLTVKVTADSKGKLTATTSYEGATKVSDDGFPVFVNEQETINLRARKTSKVNGEPLEGATYGLWMANPGGTDVYLGNAVSDQDGYMLYKDVVIEEGKKYYLKEEAAPAGHLVNPYRDKYMIFKRTDQGYEVLVEGTQEYEAYLADHGAGE